jgi:hypothetical protein
MTNKAVVYEFSGPDGSAFGIEVDEPTLDRGFRPVGREAPEEKISYHEAIDRVRPAADYLLRAVKSLDAKPDSVEVTFGIKISTKAGAVIASAAAEGNFTVKLNWKRE